MIYYHGTSDSKFRQMAKDGVIKMPVYVTTKPEIAFMFGGEEKLLEIDLSGFDVEIDSYEDDTYERDTTGRKHLFVVNTDIPMNRVKEVTK